MQTETAALGASGRMRAALLTESGRFVLVIGGEERWRHEPGCVFVPVELPGASCPDDEPPDTTLAAIGRRWFGRPLHLLPAEQTYGPSPAHAIDRLPSRATPAPLLALERLAPAEPERGIGVRRVTVEVFQATIDGERASDAVLAPEPVCGGLLLLSYQALRQVVRGLPLANLLERADVTLRLRPGAALPPETLIYLTAEYGERTLLRVAAKYGAQAIGKGL